MGVPAAVTLVVLTLAHVRFTVPCVQPVVMPTFCTVSPPSGKIYGRVIVKLLTPFQAMALNVGRAIRPRIPPVPAVSCTKALSLQRQTLPVGQPKKMGSGQPGAGP